MSLQQGVQCMRIDNTFPKTMSGQSKKKEATFTGALSNLLKTLIDKTLACIQHQGIVLTTSRHTCKTKVLQQHLAAVASISLPICLRAAHTSMRPHFRTLRTNSSGRMSRPQSCWTLPACRVSATTVSLASAKAGVAAGASTSLFS